MITHRGIWAIAHTSSRSVSKHSCIPGAYPRKHLLIPCPTSAIVGHILRRVSNKHAAFPLTKARIGLERQRQTRAVWANRTNPPIVAKIKDYENYTHAKFAQFSNNWQRFFPTHVCDTSCQSLTHVYRKLIKVGHSSRCMLPRSRSSKPPSQSRRP